MAFRRLVGWVRRRVESALSVLTAVLDIEHPHARSFEAVLTWLTTRLLAYNVYFITGPLLILVK